MTRTAAIALLALLTATPSWGQTSGALSSDRAQATAAVNQSSSEKVRDNPTNQYILDYPGDRRFGARSIFGRHGAVARASRHNTAPVPEQGRPTTGSASVIAGRLINSSSRPSGGSKP